MRKTFLTMASCAALITAQAMAAEPRSVTYTAALEAEDSLRGRTVHQSTRGSGPDEGLMLERRVRLEGVDVDRGPLDRVRLAMQLYVEHGFSATVSDGLPLDETPMDVEAAGQIETRLEILGPDGSVIASRQITGTQSGCMSIGSCTFSHHERLPVALELDVDPALFEGRAVPTLGVRLSTEAGLGEQICSVGYGWEDCRILHARIGVTTRQNGIEAIYGYGADSGAGARGPARNETVVEDHGPATAFEGSAMMMLTLGIAGALAVGGAVGLRGTDF